MRLPSCIKAVPVFVAAVFPIFPASAQELERPPTTIGVSSIFNRDITDFIGTTVTTCTQDGHRVSVTANPVSPNEEIAKDRAAGMSPNFETATKAIEAVLRSHVEEHDFEELRSAARFGRMQDLPSLQDSLRKADFPIKIEGVRMFIKPEKGLCLVVA